MVDKQPTQEELTAKRTQLLEEAKKLGFKIEDAPEFKGLLKDLNNERQTRQQVQGQVSMLQEQVDILMEEKEKAPDDKTKDDEFITRKEGKEIVGKVLRESEKEEKQRRETEFQAKLLSDENDARAKLTEEKQGKGLDFDTVLQEGYAKLLAENPAYNEVVKSAGKRGKNMAEEAYKIGLTHPDIQARIQAKKNLQTLEDIDKHGKNSKAPASIESVMSKNQSSFEDLMNKSEDDLKEMLKKAEEGKA